MRPTLFLAWAVVAGTFSGHGGPPLLAAGPAGREPSARPGRVAPAGAASTQPAAPAGSPADALVEGPPPVAARFAAPIAEARLDAVPARDALPWWSRASGVPLLVNWNALERDGLDPDAPVSLDLRGLSARQVLIIITREMAPDQDMVYERTPWYVEVVTKREADRRLVTRTYDVRDLLHVIPLLEDAGTTGDGSGTTVGRGSAGNAGGGGSRSSRTGGRSSTGGSGSRSQGSGGKQGSPRGGGGAEGEGSMQERGEALADLIRGVVEPDVWVENGGQSTIRFFQGQLIIRAPLYVHGQIGPSRGEGPQVVVRHEPRASQEPSATQPATAPAVSG